MKLAGCLLMIPACTGAASLISVESIREPLPFFDERPIYESWDAERQQKKPDGNAAVTTRSDRLWGEHSLEVLPVRTIFPAEDASIDFIVSFNPASFPVESSSLSVRLVSESGESVEERIDKLDATQMFVSLGYPASFAGGKLRLEVKLTGAKGRDETVSSELEIAPRNSPLIATEAIIQIHPQSTIAGSPCRIGVPLPRGFVRDTAELGLFDGQGKPVHCDIEATGKWAKYGSLKWVLVTFLAEGESEYYLKKRSPESHESPLLFPPVGTELGHSEVAALAEKLVEKFPGSHGATLVTEGFLRGGFVEHAKGANYTGWKHKLLNPGWKYFVPEHAQWQVERAGASLVRLRCEDWFVGEDGEKFCRFVARLRIYPGSPFLDFEYTWIFTGDGNRDRIRSMGWDFPIRNFSPHGFSDGKSAKVRIGDYLLQYDTDAFEISTDGKVTVEEGRMPGVAMGKSGKNTVAMAIRDFWENFPNEIGLSPRGFTFFLWPEHSRPRTHVLTLDNAYRLWFAHEGQTLSFQLPQELTEAPFYQALSGVEPPFAHGLPESVNAQGIAKTTEVRFYAGEDTEALPRYFVAWNDRSSDPFTDPKWVERSGAFPGMAAREEGGEWESDYHLAAQWPGRMIESLRVYGKWLYGDLPMTGDLERKTAGLYRAYNKAHWGWPYSWMPYARSGEPAFKKQADAAVRMMSDTAYCHYVSEEVEKQFAALPERSEWAAYQPFRARGWNNEGLIPWAGGYWGPTSRMYCDKVVPLFESWHLTGYIPALEVAEDWMEQTKKEEPKRFGRGPIISAPIRARWADNLLRQYVASYEATFDPWFIAAAHALAKMHLWMEASYGWKGHFWQGGATEYLRFTRDPAYGEFFLRFAKNCLAPSLADFWANIAPAIQPGVFATEYSGDSWYLQRAASFAVSLEEMIRTVKEPADYQGWLATGGANEGGLYYGWYLQWAPQLFSAWKNRSPSVELIPSGFFVRPAQAGEELLFPEIAIRIPKDRDFCEITLNASGEGASAAQVKILDNSSSIERKESLQKGVTTLRLEGAGTTHHLRIVSSKAREAGEHPIFSLRFPVAAWDVPEVYRLPQDRQLLPATSGWTAIWYQGSGKERWSIFVKSNVRKPVGRASLWDSDAHLLADAQWLARDLPAEGKKFLLEPASAASGLHKLSIPGEHTHVSGSGITTPWYATSRNKWFDPHAK